MQLANTTAAGRFSLVRVGPCTLSCVNYFKRARPTLRCQIPLSRLTFGPDNQLRRKKEKISRTKCETKPRSLTRDVRFRKRACHCYSFCVLPPSNPQACPKNSRYVQRLQTSDSAPYANSSNPMRIGSLTDTPKSTRK